MQDITLDEIISEVQADIRKMVAEGAVYFENAVRNSGLVLTGELLDSVRGIMADESNTMNATAVFEFNKYWRFKDMKQLNYSGYMNIDAIMAFVEKVGVNKFAYVPGYLDRSVTAVPVGMAKQRIAWGIIMHRRQVPTVKHDNKRRKYNTTKAAFMNVMRRKLMERIGKRSLDLVKLNMQD